MIKKLVKIKNFIRSMDIEIKAYFLCLTLMLCSLLTLLVHLLMCIIMKIPSL